MIHYVDSMADWEGVRTGGVLAYAQELRDKGSSAPSACPATTRRWPWRR